MQESLGGRCTEEARAGAGGVNAGLGEGFLMPTEKRNRADQGEKCRASGEDTPGSETWTAAGATEADRTLEQLPAVGVS
jgi:hypothetical protein